MAALVNVPFALVGWFESNEALIQNALSMSLLAFSVQLALRSGVFSLAGVGFWAIGGYGTAKLVLDGWSTPVALALLIAVSCLIALGMGLILARLRALYLAMATFAFVLIVQIIAINWESVTGGPVGLFAIPVTVTTVGLLVCVAVCAAGLALWERGRTGRRMEALREDEQLAATIGIDVRRQRLLVFIVSSALGTLSGGLYAMMFNTITPDLAGFGLITNVLMMVVLGGTGAWWGGIVGAFIVTWLPEILRFAEDYRSIIQGAIVVAVVVYAPDGVVGLVRSLRRLAARVAGPRRPAMSDPIEEAA
jgi:branched-chain amino acid transport system permease protein